MLHFNFPYFGEPNDALEDEILGTVWARAGNVKFIGHFGPADKDTRSNGVSYLPNYGYRCLRSFAASDYIFALSDAFSFSAGHDYEFNFWAEGATNKGGNIVQLLNGSSVVLSISMTSDYKIKVSVPSANFTATSSEPAMTWPDPSIPIAFACSVRFSPSGVTFWIRDSVEDVHPAANLYSDLKVTECRIGGLDGYIDEFCFKDALSVSHAWSNNVFRARVNVVDLGGFGSGALGNVIISNNCVLNTSAGLDGSKAADGSFALQSVQKGTYSSFSVGSEVMLVNASGDYCFRTITSASTSGIKLDRPHSVQYPLQAIAVPNFNTLTINKGVTVSPSAWNGKCGGIVVFRCKGDCLVNGSIITSGKGRRRDDMLQMTHAKLIDRFIQGSGGAMFFVVGGTFTAPKTARLGASWAGDSGPGHVLLNGSGTGGGAGYGGGGGSDTDSGQLGGYGGIGGGGGGADASPGYSYAGCDAGGAGDTGGCFVSSGSKVSARAGGTQGLRVGAHGINGGGGGAGGDGTSNQGVIAPCGANLVLIANACHINEDVISTGGAGGTCQNSGYQCGGGGTGFCYIATKE